MAPTRKRRLFALYIDFLMFEAALVPCLWLMGLSIGGPFALVIRLGLFAVVRTAAVRFLGASPGRWAVGIAGLPEPTVDEAILGRETWWTMTLSTLLVLEGSKNLTRWTQGLPPPPYLGEGVSDAVAFSTTSAIGLCSIVAGTLILRTSPRGAWLAACLLVLESIGALVHHDAFHEWGGRALAARRQLHGQTIQPEQLAFAQGGSTVLPLTLGIGAVIFVAVAVALQRVSTDREPPRPNIDAA